MEPYTPIRPDPVLEPWSWTAFDQASGLAGAVRNIYEDRKGTSGSPPKGTPRNTMGIDGRLTPRKRVSDTGLPLLNVVDKRKGYVLQANTDRLES